MNNVIIRKINHQRKINQNRCLESFLTAYHHIKKWIISLLQDPLLVHDVKLDLVDPTGLYNKKFLRYYHMDKKMTLETWMQSFYKSDCSSANTENKSLFATVLRLLSKLVDGVVYHILKGQIEYDFELERLEELFSAHSIPVCHLENDDNYQDIE